MYNHFYTHFTYYHGGNPYVAFNNKALFDMICKYHLEQVGDTFYHVYAERKPYKKTYAALREILRDFAIDWQLSFSRFIYYQNTLIDYQSFFEDYGKKYGLLREFRENGII